MQKISDFIRKNDKNWRTQFASSNSDKLGLRHTPFCFTEQGVAMLSSVLNSLQAIAVNIKIIRIFTRIREMWMDNTELRWAIDEIKSKTLNNTKNIELVFQYLDELLEKKDNPKPKKIVGFKINNKGVVNK